jgi:hypothetical protein
LSEKLLKNLVEASDFQAEYEGSIPFTRSNAFNNFRHSLRSILTAVLLLILTAGRPLFVMPGAPLPRALPLPGSKRRRSSRVIWCPSWKDARPTSRAGKPLPVMQLAPKAALGRAG